MMFSGNNNIYAFIEKEVKDFNRQQSIIILMLLFRKEWRIFICIATLLHSLERAAAGIGLHVNAHKTEYMRFNLTGDISTQGDSSLKLVDKFTYLGSSVSSTKKDINKRLKKGWTTIDRLAVIWKSDLIDKMKRRFLPSSGRLDTAIWMLYMDANQTDGEKAWR